MSSGSRAFPDRPLLGVGVVAVENGRVLLIERQHEPLKGYWTLPGGLVEVGETVREAAAREMLEETGIAVEVGDVVEVFERIERETIDGEVGAGARRVMYHFVIVDLLAYPARAGELPRAASDAADARWVAWNEMPDLKTTPGLEGVLEKARRLLGINIS